jgi:cobyrinic acid a,c-diamide synthase
MCGVLSGAARFTDRLTLGYREAVAVAESPLHTIGDRIMGHEFHRTAVTFAECYPPAWVWAGREVPNVRDGAVDHGVHASYLHTHPAAHPQALTRFVAAAATSKLAR